MDDKLPQIIEAIIFVADQPVKPSFLLEVLSKKHSKQLEIDEAPKNGKAKPKAKEESEEEKEEAFELTKEKLKEILEGLEKKYAEGDYPFEIKAVANGYQFYTKKAFFPYVRQAALVNHKKRLSRVALEALSIIAYRQPITKAEIEFIRGVNSDYAVQKLLDKKLVSIVGRSDAPGRPLLYATSPFFMEYFGLRDIEDLPKLKEFDDLEEEHLALFKQHQEAGDETKAKPDEQPNENEQIEALEEELLGEEGSSEAAAEETTGETEETEISGATEEEESTDQGEEDL